MAKWNVARGVGGLLVAGCVLAVWVGTEARQAGGTAVAIDADDLGGVVTGAHGPEAGVWVIAETTDLPTKFVRTVVTDDRGRYVVPDLPIASYRVWVRGYGLVDSPAVQAQPGKILNLTATPAPSPKEAAEYYPASYWFSMMRIPDKREFPGTGLAGNGISTAVESQAAFVNLTKTTGCYSCHQIGNKATREVPAALGAFSTSVAAWEHRLQTGVDGADMFGRTNRFGRRRALAMFADWSDRIVKGELPQVPPRPHGVERNVVVTQWDWSDGKIYFHDAVASDRRNPGLNANGPIYGVHENSADLMTVLDPVSHVASQVAIPVADPALMAQPVSVPKSSIYWGDEIIWNTKVTAHSNVMDQKGRLWNTSRIRRPDKNPAFCREGSTHPSAKLFPLKTSRRQYAVYDPPEKKWTLVDTCFTTFHLNFAHDPDNTIFAGAGGTLGWVNTRLLDATGDQQRAQGWAPLILDTNGNGKQDAWVEPGALPDPAKDSRIDVSFYATSVSPADGSVWGNANAFPGAIVRVALGQRPPETTLAEIYNVPWNRPEVPGAGHTPRGLDVDNNGVVWMVTGSGHLVSFDRRTCKGPLNGPTAIGQQCPEGWSFHLVPGPNFQGNPEATRADSNYYDWIDIHDTLGLGKNVPVATGNGSDSLLAFVDGQFAVLRVPYPRGFFAKQLDGRIDDAKTGWKGRGIWTTHGNRVPWHLEGGKGTKPKVLKFQVRPDPLAK
jgi:hypothetical protein